MRTSALHALAFVAGVTLAFGMSCSSPSPCPDYDDWETPHVMLPSPPADFPFEKATIVVDVASLAATITYERDGAVRRVELAEASESR